MRVKNYETGETLNGELSDELVRQSLTSLVEGDTGAVYARLDDRGVWQYVVSRDWGRHAEGAPDTITVVFVDPQ